MSNDTITLLDGIDWVKGELLSNMDDDSFYYGYLGKAALSSSAVKPLLSSAKEYYKSITEEPEYKQQFVEGQIFHTLALEPEKMDERYEIVEYERRVESVRRMNEESDKEVILRKEYNFMNAIYKKMLLCDEARELLEGGIPEVPAIGMINDIPFRAKADSLHLDHIVDLKTTAKLDTWLWTGKNKWNYDVQAYIYMTLFNVSRFTFLVVEKVTGRVAIYELSERAYESGKSKLDLATERYKKHFLYKTEEEIQDNLYNDCIKGFF